MEKVETTWSRRSSSSKMEYQKWRMAKNACSMLQHQKTRRVLSLQHWKLLQCVVYLWYLICNTEQSYIFCLFFDSELSSKCEKERRLHGWKIENENVVYVKWMDIHFSSGNTYIPKMRMRSWNEKCWTLKFEGMLYEFGVCFITYVRAYTCTHIALQYFPHSLCIM